MWEDFSFPVAPQSSVHHDSVEDSISPTSSRGALPFLDDMNAVSFDASCSIMELSEQLGNYTLEPRRRPSPPCSPSPGAYHLHHTARQDGLASPHNHYSIRRQRELLVRRQCSAASMSRLSLLVQGAIENETWNCHDRASASIDGRDTLAFGKNSILESPTPSSASTASSSEDGEFESYSTSRPQPRFKVGKEAKHRSSTDVIGRQYKDIRMRKSRKRRELLLGGRRD